jgi:hypothetical protein
MVIIRQFYEVCKKELDMKVLGKEIRADFMWCQCPECKGIAHYKRLERKNISFCREASLKKNGRDGIRKKNSEKTPIK